MPTGIYLRKPFTQEHRNKISATRKLRIAEGKIIVKGSYKCGHISWSKDKHLTEGHKHKISKAQSGEKCKLWRGGHKAYRVMKPYWKKIRAEVLKRDNYSCQRCNMVNIKLVCHHVVPYRISHDDSLENLISLCYKCHAIVDFAIIRKENIEYGIN